jgi:hypothetical protein
MNKRQALIGWVVYKAGKPIAVKVLKRKATPPVPAKKSRSRWAVTSAGVAAGLAAVGGAVFFWRKKSDGGEAPPAES